MRLAPLSSRLVLAMVVVVMAAPVARAGGTGGMTSLPRSGSTFDDVGDGSWAAVAIEYAAREHAW
ncbi:MAG: hypothetical protein M3Q20_07080, partial [Actinomycetota bacterium]|nr:hypothetical protein [Actinomycetota bacterium]